MKGRMVHTESTPTGERHGDHSHWKGRITECTPTGNLENAAHTYTEITTNGEKENGSTYTVTTHTEKAAHTYTETYQELESMMSRIRHSASRRKTTANGRE